jgi:hypothetical protein
MRAPASIAIACAALLPMIEAAAQTAAPVWREVPWPFLRDAWPNGRAFECVGGPCGARLSLYARAKNGFCDCTRGVADDDEIDRVGDVMLLSANFTPLAPSDAVALAGMAGRERLYELGDSTRRHVASLAGGRDCNAFVALVASEGGLPEAATKLAAAFINTPDMTRWVARAQGE